MMYWFAVLANFDASGPPVFAQATVHAYEHHQEDPVRKCFFSITRDEVNHEEACGRAIQRLVENPLARALLEGRFPPGSHITLDADPVSGTLVFTGGEGDTVVTDASERRDARARSEEPAAVGGRSIFDLPPASGGSDGSELPN